MSNRFVPANYLEDHEKRQIAFFRNKIKHSNSREEIEYYIDAISRIYSNLIGRIQTTEKPKKRKLIKKGTLVKSS
jgi:hypothetical protein